MNRFAISGCAMVLLSGVAFRLALHYTPALPPAPPVVRAYCTAEGQLHSNVRVVGRLDFANDEEVNTFFRTGSVHFCDPDRVSLWTERWFR